MNTIATDKTGKEVFLQKEILPPAQLEIWNQLTDTPSNFVLYGGTAIALYLGHRESVDFDFFSHQRFNPNELLQKISYLQGGEVLQNISSTLTVSVPCEKYNSNVKFSFFGVELNQVFPPLKAQDNKINIASMTDLFGMKCATVCQRAETKDYIDIDAIMKSGMSLEKGLAAAQAIYKEVYDPFLTLKALSYTDDIRNLPTEIKERLFQSIKKVNLDKMPNYQALRPIGEECKLEKRYK